jgi:pyruvate carboxylase
MAGLLKPYAAAMLVRALKDACRLPIHLHTHDTTGNQIAALLFAAEAGVDIVDTAIASMAGLTSQPSLNSLVTALGGTARDTGLDPTGLEKLTDYWADVRMRYHSFEGGIKYPTTDIYRYEIPGGQYTNLKPQAESMGLHNFEDVKKMYKTVNDMLGGIVKVTPSSKMVGDLALFMLQNKLTAENIVAQGAALSFPDSVVSYFKGMMGQPSWGFPADLQRVVLKGETPITVRPGELLPPADFDAAREHLRGVLNDEPNWRSIVSWCLYPKVVEDFFRERAEYGYITRLGSHVYFHGLAKGETNRVDLEDGKKLIIKYLEKGDLNEDGTRNVIFELNGSHREVAVIDNTVEHTTTRIQMADPENPADVSSPIPGLVSRIEVHEGERVVKNQSLLIVEAMKMETNITANVDGVVKKILIKEGQNVTAGVLLMTLETA